MTRVLESVQAGQRVGPKNQRRRTCCGSDGERLVRRATLGVLELSRHQEHFAGPDLGVDVVRQQVGGTDAFLVSELPRSPSSGYICGQLEPRFAEPRILLHGVAVLDHRLAEAFPAAT